MDLFRSFIVFLIAKMEAYGFGIKSLKFIFLTKNNIGVRCSFITEWLEILLVVATFHRAPPKLLLLFMRERVVVTLHAFE